MIESFKVGILFFFLSLAAKLPFLGTFLTIDEPRWMKGAGQFLLALQAGDFRQTYWHFHPGITITWGEAIILWLQSVGAGSGSLETFVQFQMDHLNLSVGAMRMSGVLLTSLALPFLYVFAAQLIGKWPAIIGVGLIAVDPFWVAHSRIINGDALAGILMLCAYVTFALLLVKPELKFAFFSGLFAGLSFLTKLPSQILIPCILVLVIFGFFGYRRWQFWLKALVLCGATSVLVFVALWPAMWVAPIDTLTMMVEDTFSVGDIGGKDTVEFFMGRIRPDQSPLFYPVALAFRLTPINSLGFLFGLALLLASKRWQERRSVLLLLLFMGMVLILANVSPKKADRYALSVILALDLVAGSGWIWLVGKVPARYPARNISVASAILLISGQLIFVLISYPYVLSYYNPLLGGYAGAARSVPVGRGEGLEEAAAWINRQQDASQSRVSPYYRNVTNPYLEGRSLGFSESGESQLLADYVIFYITQTQRNLPYPGLVEYFQRRQPVHTISQSGTPYVWVYKQDQPIKELTGDTGIIGRATLVGYHLDQEIPNAGSATEVTLYMLTEDQGLPDNEDFTVSLLDNDGAAHGRWVGNVDNQWSPNGVVEWRGILTLPPGIEPGAYRLKVALIDTNINAEVTSFAFEDEYISLGP